MKNRSIIMLLAVVFLAVLMLASCVPDEPAHQHEWTDATCTAPKTCSTCGETEGEALGHTEEVLAGKAATCTEDGLTEGKKCSVCEEILLAQETIPATGHKEESLPGKDATCTETGLTEGKKCSSCNEILLPQDEIPLKSHSYDEGWDEDCNVCGATRTCPHDGEKIVVPGSAASCTATGLTDGEKCAICGDITVAQNVIDALGHDLSAATCTEAAHCQREHCDYVEGQALGHSYVDTVVPATCISKGYTEHVCSACGDRYVDGETALAEHKYEGVVTTAPTCEGEGLMTYTCSVKDCGHSYTEAIEATGHSEIAHEGKAATCTEDGYEAYVSCANCDYTTYKSISALGHKGGKATCSSLAECTVCGEKYGNYDLVNGHHYGEADCESPATCTLCGATSGSAIGHIDENKDHVCDRTACNEAMGTCEDADKDHTCDYGCGKSYGTCEDADKDHACDYGCKKVYGTCEDENKDHACDYGCNKVFGEHKDGDDNNHTCDYGCNKPVDGEVCVDENPKNHICDECSANVGGECADGEDNDHLCDYCGASVGEACYGGTATCTNKAVCVECGKEYGELLAHEYNQTNAVEAALKSAATCESPAVYYYSCSCGKVYKADDANTFESGEALGHNYVETVTAPTCTEAGFTINECSRCGDTIRSDEVAALDHDMIIDAAVAPTCTESGLTEGSHCSRCDYAIAQTVINALGHKEVIDAAVAPTCSNIGLTEGKHCDTCGEVILSQTVLPIAHNFVDGVCASCEMSENIFAGKNFVPTEGIAAENIYSANYGYGTLTDGIIYQEGSGRFSSKKNGGIVEATINLEGIYSLSEFRVYLYSAGLSNLGTGFTVKLYSNGEWITAVDCKSADELQSNWSDNPDGNKDWLIFDLTGYSASKIMFTIPAQTTAGWTTVYEIACSGKLEGCLHDWNDATCSAPKTCSKCGATEGEALPHDEVIDAAVAATCTETGLTEGKHCSVCNKVLVAQQVIPMHNFVDGECSDCGINLNIFANKVFIPTDEALASVLSATWWKGSGYPGLTDGIKNADNAPGRFSTVMALTGMMDATIDLGIEYELESFRMYVYEVSESSVTALTNVGADLLIQVYANGEWTDVVSCADSTAICEHLVVVPGANNNYLEFNLNGIVAEKIRFYISSSVTGSGTTFQEFECVGKKHAHVHEWTDATCTSPKTCTTCGDTEGSALGHNYVDGVCTRCDSAKTLIDNVFAGKNFTPTSDALASVLSAGWWKGGGYETLTDGIKNADNAPGRFSTVMALTGMMDATIDLGAGYELHSLKFFTYDPSSATGASSLGASLLIQVYANGEWTDVVTCADNASIVAYLVSTDGAFNDYLEFDLGGIAAEKVRFYISASASGSGTTYEEIECTGYEK